MQTLEVKRNFMSEQVKSLEQDKYFAQKRRATIDLVASPKNFKISP